jgi:hypothetical protein
MSWCLVKNEFMAVSPMITQRGNHGLRGRSVLPCKGGTRRKPGSLALSEELEGYALVPRARYRTSATQAAKGGRVSLFAGVLCRPFGLESSGCRCEP